MQCKRQAYWKSEYQEFKNWIKDSPATRSYKDFAKRQFHKVRRQFDKKLINNILNERKGYENYLIRSIWDNNYDHFYDIMYPERLTNPSDHKEHNHKFKLKTILENEYIQRFY